MSEQISALMDDEIAVEDANRLIGSLHSSKQATEAWGEYHLIGDAMRGNAMLSKDFKQNLMQKLDMEPTVLAPKAAQYNSQKLADLKDKLPVKWSIAASFAAVMVVGWMALQQQVQPESGAPAMEMAQTEVMDQAIPNEYLSAHQASAPSTSSYYIQPVNYAE
jgi:sigma-E factor negative regulatory protein RseA